MDLRKNKYFEFLIRKVGGSGGGSGDGEINTGTNIGDSGVGVYNTKVGTELQFKKLRSLAPELTITNNGVTQTVDFDLDISESGTTYLSSGFDTCSGITDNGDGTITVGDEDVILSSTSDHSLPLTKYTLTGDTFSITQDVTTYIVGDYNSGSPIFRAITDVELITESDVVPFVTLFMNGDNVVHVIDWDCLGRGLVNKIHMRLVKTQRFAHETGITLSEVSPDGYITISEGKFWYGAVRKTFSAYNSNIDNLRFYYHSSGSWTYSDLGNMVINDQYDDGTDLGVLGNNEYVNNWIYICGESTPWAYIVLGNKYSKLSLALAEEIPTLPHFLQTHGILVGRITYKKDGTSAETIVSAWESVFSGNIPTDHNDLAGLTETDVHPASSISTDTTNFEDKLSSADDTTQKALDTLDNHIHDAQSITSFSSEVHLSTAEIRKEPNGFLNDDVSISFNDTTRLLTLTPIDTSYTIFHQGKQIDISTNKTITTTDVSGSHWIYFDTNGDLQESVNPSNSLDLILNQVLVCYIGWNAESGQAVFLNRESHGLLMNGVTHLYLHEFEGTRYDGGFGLSDFETGDGSLNSDVQLGIEDGMIYDEDLGHHINETNYPQTLNSILNAPKLYKSGTSGYFVASANTDYIGLSAGTGRLAYNNINANGTGDWGLTEVPDKSYVNMYIIASPDVNNPIKIIVGQNYYTTLDDARNSNDFELLNLINLESAEFKFLHRVVVYSRNIYTNILKSVIYYDPTLDDLRTTIRNESTVVSSITSHSSLVNRDATGSHPTTAISVDSSTFTGVLSITDINTQLALETIDGHGHDTSDITNFNSDVQSIINDSSFTTSDITDFNSATTSIISDTSINTLNDVNILSTTDGQALVWNETTSKWENTSLTLGSTTLNGLTDTNVDTILDGHFLIYSTSQSKWINSNGLAQRVLLTTSSFNGILSATENNVQLAMDVLDDHAHTIEDLSNTNISTISDGQALVWDSGTSKWINSTLSTGATELNGLSDVSLGTLATNDVLYYNGSNWTNIQLDLDGTDISLDTTSFNGILSATENNVQLAMDVLDDHGHNTSDITDFNSATTSIISSASITELVDVTFTSSADGDLLKINGSGNVVNEKDLKVVGVTLGGKGTDLAITDSSYPVSIPYAGTIVKVIANVNTAPVGASIIADVNLNGTSIWNTTQANRVSISASATSGSQTSFDTTAISENDVITVDVDQVGSTTAGQDLTVMVVINKS